MGLPPHPGRLRHPPHTFSGEPCARLAVGQAQDHPQRGSREREQILPLRELDMCDNIPRAAQSTLGAIPSVRKALLQG